MHSASTTYLLILAAILAVVAGGLLYVSSVARTVGVTIATYQGCVDAGYPVMESYPTQCRTPDGRTFVNPQQQVVPDDGLTTLPGPSDGGAAGGTYPAGGCAVAGCSGQLCVESGEASDIITTCEYRAEYACYRTARCERQASGKCGWTQTPALTQCLANPPQDSGPNVY